MRDPEAEKTALLLLDLVAEKQRETQGPVMRYANAAIDNPINFDK